MNMGKKGKEVPGRAGNAKHLIDVPSWRWAGASGSGSGSGWWAPAVKSLPVLARILTALR